MIQTSAIPIQLGSISAGSLLGTAGSAAIISSINDTLGTGTSFFGSVFDKFQGMRNAFIENIIKPIQQATTTIGHVVNALMNPDIIRPLTSLEDLKAIPPIMQEAILFYKPVRSLLEQGRISGFGIDPSHMQEEDVWGRLINNGVVEDALEAADDDGKIYLNYHFESTDPRPTFAELDAVEETRNFIAEMLNTTPWDPTDVTEERG